MITGQAVSSNHYFYVSRFGKCMKNATYHLNDPIQDTEWTDLLQFIIDSGCIVRARMGIIVRRVTIINGKKRFIKGY